MITHISKAVMYVADQQQSADFYVDKFGFTKLVDEEMFPGARWLELEPPHGQTTLVLSSAEAFGKQPGEARTSTSLATTSTRRRNNSAGWG